MEIMEIIENHDHLTAICNTSFYDYRLMIHVVSFWISIVGVTHKLRQVEVELYDTITLQFLR